MSDNVPTEQGDQGLTRRELLRKGAVLGGALAWSIPTIQTFRMAPAFAAATSFAISYMAMVIQCGDKYYQVKYDVGEGWSENGSLPCGSDQANRSWPSEYEYSSWNDIRPLPEPSVTPISGDKVKYTFDFRGLADGSCTVVWSLNKCAQLCESGPTGSVVTFEPCPNPEA
jgi:hypothetical protein